MAERRKPPSGYFGSLELVVPTAPQWLDARGVAWTKRKRNQRSRILGYRAVVQELGGIMGLRHLAFGTTLHPTRRLATTEAHRILADICATGGGNG